MGGYRFDAELDTRHKMIELLNCDCMEYMATVPDKYFDLAIVDPPYGIGEHGGKRRQKKDRPNSYFMPLKHQNKKWDNNAPEKAYFDELQRISKNQIIWGANHFISRLPFDSSCWIVWDKNIGGDQADCEIAWTSFKSAIRKFFGHPFIGTNGGKERIHPTQKPIALYEWLLTNYAKKGQRVFDSHLGSASSAIAAHYFGVDFVGCELDKDYFEAAKARFDMATKQLAIDL